ncbi:MAG: DUF2442 domain-containing protein [bacterium]|nr:DUF2442 domain-containing protein [bacterium]
MDKPLYNVQGIVFEQNRMTLRVDDRKFLFDLADISKRLEKASKPEREKYEISPSGYGIHWPLIDEDLSVSGLLKTASLGHKSKTSPASMAG